MLTRNATLPPVRCGQHVCCATHCTPLLQCCLQVSYTLGAWVVALPSHACLECLCDRLLCVLLCCVQSLVRTAPVCPLFHAALFRDVSDEGQAIVIEVIGSCMVALPTSACLSPRFLLTATSILPVSWVLFV
jgi:hypothetical protein